MGTGNKLFFLFFPSYKNILAEDSFVICVVKDLDILRWVRATNAFEIFQKRLGTAACVHSCVWMRACECVSVTCPCAVCLTDIWLRASLGFHGQLAMRGKPPAENSSLSTDLEPAPISSLWLPLAYWGQCSASPGLLQSTKILHEFLLLK